MAFLPYSINMEVTLDDFQLILYFWNKLYVLMMCYSLYKLPDSFVTFL